MKCALTIGLALGLGACVGKNFGHGASHAPRPAIQFPASGITYQPASNLPKGVEIAVLEGDPKREGMFTIRLKAQPGLSLAPHTHPTDERVTVLEGTVSVGFGNATDRMAAKKFGAGSFYVNPAKVVHYVFSDDGCTLQITGEGPWRVDFQPTTP